MLYFFRSIHANWLNSKFFITEIWKLKPDLKRIRKTINFDKP